MYDYDNFNYNINKSLQADGSIVAPFSGVQILPPDAKRAEIYKRAQPVVNKWLDVDGSTFERDFNGGGGGSTNFGAAFYQTNIPNDSDAQNLVGRNLQSGDLWFSTFNNSVFYYDTNVSSWTTANHSIGRGANLPSNGSFGQSFVNTTDNRFYSHDGADWVAVAIAASDVMIQQTIVPTLENVQQTLDYLLDYTCETQALKSTPQPLPNTQTPVVFDTIAGRFAELDIVDGSIIRFKESGWYRATHQGIFNASSNGGVVKYGINTPVQLIQGEEKEVDAGISLLNETYTFFANIDDEYQFLCEDEGTGSITYQSGTLMIKKIPIC